MSLALAAKPAFKVIGPNGVPTTFNSIEEAMDAARGLVYLSSRQVDTHVKRLKQGQPTHWAYEFSTVNVEVTQ